MTSPINPAAEWPLPPGAFTSQATYLQRAKDCDTPPPPLVNRIMLDLETLGRRPGCPLLQIGAADSLGYSFLETVDVTDQLLNYPVEIDPDTQRWWRQDAPQEARDQVSRLPKAPLRWCLRRFGEWYHSMLGQEKELWCLGASFDFPILEHAYHLAGVPVPWHYRELRCARTVFQLAKAQGWQRPQREGGTAHTAMADAVNQMDDLKEALKWIATSNSSSMS